jgi:hypothetical protein
MTTAKSKAARVSRRDLFKELSEGTTALGEARSGKRTLRTHVAQFKPAPEVSPDQSRPALSRYCGEARRNLKRPS